MKIGYARVSTDEQNLDLQMDALQSAGCDHIYTDNGVSGSIDPFKRPGFIEARSILGAEDTFIVWKLDRIGRSLGSLISLMGEFKADNINVVSLTDGIDTTTHGGKLVFHIMGALAEFERDLISERTKAGMVSAKKRGKHIGRPRKLSPTRVKHARQQIDQGTTIVDMADLLGVSPLTLSRALKKTI